MGARSPLSTVHCLLEGSTQLRKFRPPASALRALGLTGHESWGVLVDILAAAGDGLCGHLAHGRRARHLRLLRSHKHGRVHLALHKGWEEGWAWVLGRGSGNQISTVRRLPDYSSGGCCCCDGSALRAPAARRAHLLHQPLQVPHHRQVSLGVEILALLRGKRGESTCHLSTLLDCLGPWWRYGRCTAPAVCDGIRLANNVCVRMLARVQASHTLHQPTPREPQV